MLRRSIAAAVLASTVMSVAASTTCGPGSLCPAESPCCSQYGECGVGAFCLGGCDPSFSHSLDSCMPAPICTSKNYVMNSVDSLSPNTQYLGDASKADWVSSGTAAPYPDSNPDSLLLTMPKNSVGTLLASTAYVWYGKITARMKTSRTQGVVTAFILLSDVKDEIDFEFVGTELTTAQSNFYYQGLPIYTNSKNLTLSSDSFDNWHDYEIDWSPDSLKWSVDGQVMRTLNRADTWNATGNAYYYPQTPARIQLSLWPAGIPSNGQGTVQWAGGLINWDSPDVQDTGYFYAAISSINLTCYDPPDNANVQGDKSYIYTDVVGTNNTVEITNDQTVLGSLEDTGLDPTSSVASTAASAPTAAPNVPGLGSTGSGTSGQRGGSGTQPDVAVGSTYHGWFQGASNSNSGGGSGSDAATLHGEHARHGSVLAVLLAIAALLVM